MGNSNGKVNYGSFLTEWGNRWLIKLGFTHGLSFLQELSKKYCQLDNLCAYQELLAVVKAARSSGNLLDR